MAPAGTDKVLTADQAAAISAWGPGGVHRLTTPDDRQQHPASGHQVAPRSCRAARSSGRAGCVTVHEATASEPACAQNSRAATLERRPVRRMSAPVSPPDSPCRRGAAGGVAPDATPRLNVPRCAALAAAPGLVLSTGDAAKIGRRAERSAGGVMPITPGPVERRAPNAAAQQHPKVNPTRPGRCSSSIDQWSLLSLKEQMAPCRSRPSPPRRVQVPRAVMTARTRNRLHRWQFLFCWSARRVASFFSEHRQRRPTLAARFAPAPPGYLAVSRPASRR